MHKVAYSNVENINAISCWTIFFTLDGFWVDISNFQIKLKSIKYLIEIMDNHIYVLYFCLFKCKIIAFFKNIDFTSEPVSSHPNHVEFLIPYNFTLLGRNHLHRSTIRDQLSLETSWPLYKTHRVPKFSLETPRFSSETPHLHVRSPDFHRRPQMCIRDPQIFIGDHKFAWETPRFSSETINLHERLPDFHLDLLWYEMMISSQIICRISKSVHTLHKPVLIFLWIIFEV